MAKRVLEFRQSASLDEQREDILSRLNLANAYEVYHDLSPELRADRKIALAVMRVDGLALQVAPVELQDDEEVVVTAVQNTDFAWPFASKILQGEKDRINFEVKKRRYTASKEAVPRALEEERERNTPKKLKDAA